MAGPSDMVAHTDGTWFRHPPVPANVVIRPKAPNRTKTPAPDLDPAPGLDLDLDADLDLDLDPGLDLDLNLDLDLHLGLGAKPSVAPRRHACVRSSSCADWA